MRRSIIVAALIAALFIPFSSEAAKPEWPTENGVPVEANFGAKSIGTPTITLTPGIEFDIGSRLPTGTIGFSFDVWDGDVLLGHEDNLATATAKWRGYKVASGTVGQIWNGCGGSTTHLWAIPNGAATVTLILGAAWGDWEE